MARTPATKSSTRPIRPARSAAPAVFANEEDEIESSADDAEEGAEDDLADEDDDEGPAGDDDDGNDMITLLTEFKKRKAKQASARTAAFQAEKKALYAAGRKHVLEVSQAGVAHIEEARARIKEEFMAQEKSPEKHFKDMVQNMQVHDESVRSITAIYSSFLEDLVPQRVQQIDSIHAALESHSSDREKSRKKHLKAAKSKFLQGLEQQQISTEAEQLIKHYKALLLCD